jgi:photoactive yellow protein
VSGSNGFAEIPFGSFELDEEGTVVRYNPPTGEKINDSVKNVVGRCFFSELIPGAQAHDLKNRFLKFMSDSHSVERFSVDFPFMQSSIKVQIRVARIIERFGNEHKQFAILRLVPDA